MSQTKIDNILPKFQYKRLPEQLAGTSKKFHDLAVDLAARGATDPEELYQSLRKLLEAKDCAVRAVIKCPTIGHKEEVGVETPRT